MSEGAVRIAVHRLRRYRELLRDEIGQPVASADQVEGGAISTDHARGHDFGSGWLFAGVGGGVMPAHFQPLDEEPVPVITFRCDECSRTLRVDDSLSGKKARCPACRQKTLIPSPPSDTSAAESATLPPAPPAETATLPPSRPADPPESATLPPSQNPTSDVTLGPRPSAPVSADARAPAGYVIEKELGRGGMGVVYLARSVALRRPCALKMILSGAHSGEADLERFRTEAQAIARLQHPGIVQVFEVGEHDGRPFMALEFCGGGSLDGKLSKNPLKPKEAAKLVRSLAEAMHAAHEAKVIHRDLKPANVLLTDKGEPKITDFGLAKKLDEGGATRTGSVMGTPSYMPPEQAEGKKDVGPAADVYALGAILYECLASRPPFRAATPLDTILQVVTEDPVPVRQLNPQAPTDLETIAHKCLQKDPRKRYASAQALTDDLGRYLAGEPIQARPVGAVERAVKWARRRPALASLLATIGVALALLIGGGSWFMLKLDDARRNAESAARSEAGARQVAEDEKLEAQRQRERAESALYGSGLRQAQRDLDSGNFAFAAEALHGCPAERRGWEWNHLRHATLPAPRSVVLSDPNVWDVAFAPDGARLLVAGHLGLHSFDYRSGNRLPDLTTSAIPVQLACTADGSQLIAGLADGSVLFFDSGAGEAVDLIKAHAAGCHALAVSGDGKLMATAGAVYDQKKSAWVGGELKLFDLRTRKRLQVQTGIGSRITAVHFSADGRHLVVTAELSRDAGSDLWKSSGFDGPGGGERSFLRSWQVGADRKLTPGPAMPLATYSRGISAHPREPSLAFVDGERVRFWRAGGATDDALPGPFRSPGPMQFSPDGRRLAVVDGNSIQFWDVRSRRRRFNLACPSSVQSLHFSRDGQFMAARVHQMDEKAAPVLVWDLRDGLAGWPHLAEGSPERTEGFFQSAFGPRADWLVAVSGRYAFPSQSEEIARWDLRSGTYRWRQPRPHGARRPNSVAVSPDGARIASAGDDQTLRTWDAETGKNLLTLQQRGVVAAVCFDPDGKTLWSGGNVYAGDRVAGGEVNAWDAASGQPLLTLASVGGSVTALSVSPTGDRLAALYTPHGNRGTRAVVFDTAGRRETCQIDGPSCLALSKDGTRLAGAVGNVVKVWNADTGAEVLSLIGHRLAVTAVVLSPDGTRLFSAAGSNKHDVEGEVKVWEARLGQELLSLSGPSGWVHHLAISSDGERLALSGSDSRTRGRSPVLRTLEAPARPDDRESALAWHARQARAASDDGDPGAALFHLRRLAADRKVQNDPTPAGLRLAPQVVGQPGPLHLLPFLDSRVTTEVETLAELASLRRSLAGR